MCWPDKHKSHTEEVWSGSPSAVVFLQMSMCQASQHWPFSWGDAMMRCTVGSSQQTSCLRVGPISKLRPQHPAQVERPKALTFGSTKKVMKVCTHLAEFILNQVEPLSILAKGGLRVAQMSQGWLAIMELILSKNTLIIYIYIYIWKAQQMPHQRVMQVRQ